MKMTARKSGGNSTTEMFDWFDVVEVRVTSVPLDLQSSSTNFFQSLLLITEPSSSEALLLGFLPFAFPRSFFFESFSSFMLSFPFLSRSCLELSKLTCRIVGGQRTRGGVGSCKNLLFLWY